MFFDAKVKQDRGQYRLTRVWKLIRFPPFPSASWSLSQPQVYRSIIDDVVANIQVDFEEYGMEDEVLINLQAVSDLCTFFHPLF